MQMQHTTRTGRVAGVGIPAEWCNTCCVSTAPEPGYIPEWDLADRMRKTLRDSGLSVAEVAEYFGVNRNTIGNWINGHVVPDLTTQRLWALRFGVPLCWLVSGDPCPEHGGPDGGIPLTTRYVEYATVADISTLSHRRAHHAARTAPNPAAA